MKKKVMAVVMAVIMAVVSAYAAASVIYKKICRRYLKSMEYPMADSLAQDNDAASNKWDIDLNMGI